MSRGRAVEGFELAVVRAEQQRAEVIPTPDILTSHTRAFRLQLNHSLVLLWLKEMNLRGCQIQNYFFCVVLPFWSSPPLLFH